MRWSAYAGDSVETKYVYFEDDGNQKSELTVLVIINGTEENNVHDLKKYLLWEDCEPLKLNNWTVL